MQHHGMVAGVSQARLSFSPAGFLAFGAPRDDDGSLGCEGYRKRP